MQSETTVVLSGSSIPHSVSSTGLTVEPRRTDADFFSTALTRLERLNEGFYNICGSFVFGQMMSGANDGMVPRHIIGRKKRKCLHERQC